MILLDTDTCIHILRGNETVINKRKFCDDLIGISFMTVAELFYGVFKSTNPLKNRALVEKFILTVNVIDSNILIMKKFGQLKVDLENNGNKLADADLFIAATAILNKAKLITGNTKHFKRFEELNLDNWIK